MGNIASGVALCILIAAYASWNSKRRGLPLPPGPPAHPIIGHLLKMPADNSGVLFYELSKIYGKISCLWLPGRTMIILNSAKAAIDLLDKRSNIYSDRAPSDVFLLMGWTHNMVFFPYGKRFHKHRKMLNEYFARDKCSAYQHVQLLEARKLVQNLATTPDRFDEHLNRFSTGIILRINYGHEMLSEEDMYFKVVTDVGYCNTHCAAPGSNIVDLLPIMKYLPSWFPGTFPATQARLFKPMIERMHDFPFNDVLKQMDAGTAQESFIQTHLEGQRKEGDNYTYSVDDIKGASGIIYSAGADTTWSTTAIFILAMVLFPDVQKKAQQEIDNVIDNDRFPDFNDRRNLPYLDLVVQETYRWNNAVPTGIPHKTLEDDVYDGMFIPKGAIVVANTRGMTLDEDVYSRPHSFDPGRYLRGEPYPVGQFGFGRRKCPGRHLADASVWIAIAYILSVFKISPVIDPADGSPILPKEKFKSGITSHPKPFKCRIEPRNGRLKTLDDL